VAVASGANTGIPAGAQYVPDALTGPGYSYDGIMYAGNEAGIQAMEQAAAQQGAPTTGAPLAGGTSTGTDANGVPLLSQTPGYEAAEGNALATGPSQWANLATYAQQLNADNAIDAGVNSSAGNTAAADAALASSGGLSSGARERVQESGQKDLMSMAQGVDQTLANNTLSISQQDLLNRQNQLANFNQLSSSDIANQDAEVAAQQTANAIQNSSSKGK
jgi:hypothetical protein